MDSFIAEIFQELVDRTDGEPDIENPKHYAVLSEILHEKELPSHFIDEFLSNLTDYIHKGD